MYISCERWLHWTAHSLSDSFLQLSEESLRWSVSRRTNTIHKSWIIRQNNMSITANDVPLILLRHLCRQRQPPTWTHGVTPPVPLPFINVHSSLFQDNQKHHPDRKHFGRTQIKSQICSVSVFILKKLTWLSVRVPFKSPNLLRRQHVIWAFLSCVRSVYTKDLAYNPWAFLRSSWVENARTLRMQH